MTKWIQMVPAPVPVPAQVHPPSPNNWTLSTSSWRSGAGLAPVESFQNCRPYVSPKRPQCALGSYGDGSKPWYLVNPKIAGKWMFIPLKMVCIGIDPYPYLVMLPGTSNSSWGARQPDPKPGDGALAAHPSVVLPWHRAHLHPATATSALHEKNTEDTEVNWNSQSFSNRVVRGLHFHWDILGPCMTVNWELF